MSVIILTDNTVASIMVLTGTETRYLTAWFNQSPSLCLRVTALHKIRFRPVIIALIRPAALCEERLPCVSKKTDKLWSSFVTQSLPRNRRMRKVFFLKLNSGPPQRFLYSFPLLLFLFSANKYQQIQLSWTDWLENVPGFISLAVTCPSTRLSVVYFKWFILFISF